MWTLFVGTVGASAPAVEIEWRKDSSTIRVTPPADRKVAPEAPAALRLGWGDRSWRLEADGAALSHGAGAVDLRGAALAGELEIGLCDLAGGACQLTTWRVSGEVPSGNKGRVELLVAAGSAPRDPATPFGPRATADAADQAFARARAEGKLVLLDFSAVWCPPCNLLAAEVLHGPPSEVLDGYAVAVLDVDHPSSFALKDRYAVGGYPTVIAVDPDGNELSRTVGYSDRASFLEWLGEAAGATDGADLARDPAEVSPERALELGLALAETGQAERAEPWLARAEQGPDGVDLRILRGSVREGVEDLRWLWANAPERAGDYVDQAMTHHEAEPALARAVMTRALIDARGPEVTNLMWLAAQVEEDAERRRAWFAAAAGLVASALTGDPERDKGRIEELADLRHDAGDPEGALAVLREAAATWPDEPTFHLALAPLLSELGRHEEALAAADRAIATSWGDNRLRAALSRARALRAAGREEEARALVSATLAAEPPPPEDLEVRTHRYRKQLEAFLAPVAAK